MLEQTAPTAPRVTPELISRLVAHYARLDGLTGPARDAAGTAWTFRCRVVPGLKHRDPKTGEESDAWAVVDPGAGGTARIADVQVRDIDATPIPGFDGDPMLEIRVTVAHELGHVVVADAVGPSGILTIPAEEHIVETWAQALVAAEGTSDGPVMARAAAGLAPALRARVASRARISAGAGQRARGEGMDPKMVTQALDALIEEGGGDGKCAALLKQIIAAAAGAPAGAPEPGGEAPPSDARPDPPPPGGPPPAATAARPPGAAPTGEPGEDTSMRKARLAADDLVRIHAAQLPTAKTALVMGARARLVLTPATEKRIMAAGTFAEAEAILAIVEEAGGGTSQRARSGVEHGAAPDTAGGAAVTGEPDAKLIAEGFDATWIAERYRPACAAGKDAAEQTLASGRVGLARKRARVAKEQAANGGAS